MFKSQPRISDTNFWRLRYGLGIGVSMLFAGYGLYSIATQQSYIFLRRVGFVHVKGEEAIFAGIAWTGIAVVLFAQYYAQYHQKMGFYYEWILAPGALMVIGGFLGCSYLLITQ